MRLTEVRRTTAVGEWLSTAPTRATVWPTYAPIVFLFTRGDVALPVGAPPKSIVTCLVDAFVLVGAKV